MSNVSRSVFQKLKEENKQLLADIKILATGDFDEYIEVHFKWCDYFRKEKVFNETIKIACTEIILENPDKYPDYLVQKAKENSETK